MFCSFIILKDEAKLNPVECPAVRDYKSEQQRTFFMVANNVFYTTAGMPAWMVVRNLAVV
ncbi:hypothetical protein [Reichenbachiella sp. MALMAid0571]|uniref:hypothetical protein n=1 Tax=Reichenbachiella sp. MALMAid0571 TaxID=3143939 RepID=UPI0032DE91B8